MSNVLPEEEVFSAFYFGPLFIVGRCLRSTSDWIDRVILNRTTDFYLNTLNDKPTITKYLMILPRFCASKVGLQVWKRPYKIKQVKK